MIAAEKQDVCQLHADMDITMIKKMILNNIFMQTVLEILKLKYVRLLMSVKDKIILITGASDGIGKTVALEFAKRS